MMTEEKMVMVTTLVGLSGTLLGVFLTLCVQWFMSTRQQKNLFRLAALFDHIMHYPWVLTTHRYDTTIKLLTDLGPRIIQPGEDKLRELQEANRHTKGSQGII